jgi:hypothetical protein
MKPTVGSNGPKRTSNNSTKTKPKNPPKKKLQNPHLKSKSSPTPPLQIPPAPNQVYDGPMGMWTSPVTDNLSIEQINRDFFRHFSLAQKVSKEGENNGIRGLFATQDIQIGDIITAIPAGEAITESLARNSTVGQLVQTILEELSGKNSQISIKNIFFDEFDQIIISPGHIILFTYLIFLRFTNQPTELGVEELGRYISANQQNENIDVVDRHRIYARWLPTEYTLPICWPHSLMEETGFIFSDMYKSTQSRLRHLWGIFFLIFETNLFPKFPNVFSPQIYTFERFVWAYCAYTSRSFPSHFVQHYLIVERLYHLNHHVLFPEVYPRSNSLSSTPHPALTTYNDISLCGVMLPYMDLTNHKNNHPINWLCGPHSILNSSTPSLRPVSTRLDGNNPNPADIDGYYPIDCIGRDIITNSNSLLKSLLSSKNGVLYETILDKYTVISNPIESTIHPIILSPNFCYSIFPPSSTNPSPPSVPTTTFFNQTFYPNYLGQREGGLDIDSNAACLNNVDKTNNTNETGSLIPSLRPTTHTNIVFNPNGSPHGDYISYQARVGYNKGDEIFNNYGPKTQDELLFGYGFVLEGFITGEVGTKNSKTCCLNFSPNNAVFVQLPKITSNNPQIQQDLLHQFISSISTQFTNPVQKNYFLKNPFLFELTSNGLPIGLVKIMSLLSTTNLDLDISRVPGGGDVGGGGGSVEKEFGLGNGTLGFDDGFQLDLHSRQRGLVFLLQQLLNKLHMTSNPAIISMFSNVGTIQTVKYLTKLQTLVQIFFQNEQMSNNEGKNQILLSDPFSPTTFPYFSSTLPQIFNQFRLLSLYQIMKLIYLCPFAAPSYYHHQFQIVKSHADKSSSTAAKIEKSLTPKSAQNLINKIDLSSHIALISSLTASISYDSDVSSANNIDSSSFKPQIWDYKHYCAVLHHITQNYLRFISIEHTLELLSKSVPNPLITTPPTTFEHIQINSKELGAFTFWINSIPIQGSVFSVLGNIKEQQQNDQHFEQNLTLFQEMVQNFRPIKCNMYYSIDHFWVPNTNCINNCELLYIPVEYSLSVSNLSKSQQIAPISNRFQANNDYNHVKAQKDTHVNPPTRHFPLLSQIAQSIRIYSQEIFGGVDFYIEMALLILYIRQLCFFINSIIHKREHNITTMNEKLYAIFVSQISLTETELQLYLVWDEIISTHFNRQLGTDFVQIPPLQGSQYLNLQFGMLAAFSTCDCPTVITKSHGMDTTDDSGMGETVEGGDPEQNKCPNCFQCCKNSPVIGNNPILSEEDIIIMARDMILKTIISIHKHFEKNQSPTCPYLVSGIFGSNFETTFTDDLFIAFHLIHQLKVGSGPDLKLIPLPFPLSPTTHHLKQTVPKTIATPHHHHTPQNNQIVQNHIGYPLSNPNGYSIHAFLGKNSSKTTNTPNDTIFPIFCPLDTPLEILSAQNIAKEDAGIIDSTVSYVSTQFSPKVHRDKFVLSSKQKEEFDFFNNWVQNYPNYHKSISDLKHCENTTECKLTDFIPADPNSRLIPKDAKKSKKDEEEPLIVSSPRIGDPSDMLLRFDTGSYRHLIRQAMCNLNLANKKVPQQLQSTNSILVYYGDNETSVKIQLPNQNNILTLPFIPSKSYSLCSKWFLNALFSLSKIDLFFAFQKTTQQNNSINNIPSAMLEIGGSNLTQLSRSNNENETNQSASLLPAYLTEWLNGYDIETVMNTLLNSTDLFSHQFISIPSIFPQKINFSNFGQKQSPQSEISLLPQHLISCFLRILHIAAGIVDSEDEIDFGFDFSTGMDSENNDKNDDNDGQNDNHNNDINPLDKTLPTPLTDPQLAQLFSTYPSTCVKSLQVEIIETHKRINSLVMNGIDTENDLSDRDSVNRVRHAQIIETVRWGRVLDSVLMMRLNSHIRSLCMVLDKYAAIGMGCGKSQSVDKKQRYQEILNTIFNIDFNPLYLSLDEITIPVIFHIISISTLFLVLQRK